ncbi:hypothetical protein [Mesorhizobium sp. M0586]|uniref:hypothetical protein n=1 Tax=unclassified Mesorhizobium TaxID=325217 RepID=UPI00333524F9
MLLEKNTRRRKNDRPHLGWLNPYTGIISTVSAIVVSLVSVYNIYLTTRQSEIAERAINLSNRNTEMANLLVSLRKTCQSAAALRAVFFGNTSFYYKPDFNMRDPQKPTDGEKLKITFVEPPKYPKPSTPQVLKIGKEYLSFSEDTLSRFQVVELYLTDQEAAEEEAKNLRYAFEELVDVADMVTNEEASTQDLIGNMIVASSMCRLLPEKLSPWFRNSQANRLGYIFTESDVRFEWIKEPEDFVATRQSWGLSLEDRTENEGTMRQRLLNPPSEF